jgi:hypothetical protein
VEVVWERFLVAVDVVALVDPDDHELDRWAAGDLFERLVFAGVPATRDPHGDAAAFGGRAEYLDLLVAAPQGLVTVHTPGAGIGMVDLLPPETTAMVMDWYRRYVDAC